MSFEPKKEIRNIDLMCFHTEGLPVFTIEPCDLSVMGYTSAFVTLKPFLELQRDMALQHGSATRTIFMRKPWQLSEYPFTEAELKNIYFNNHKLGFTFLESLKIKVQLNPEATSIQVDGLHASVICSLEAFADTIACCNHRIERPRQTHGTAFLYTANREERQRAGSIACPPLGDWLGIE